MRIERCALSMETIHRTPLFRQPCSGIVPSKSLSCDFFFFSTVTGEQSGPERSDLSGAKAAVGAGGGEVTDGADHLPCLYSRNSIETFLGSGGEDAF